LRGLGWRHGAGTTRQRARRSGGEVVSDGCEEGIDGITGTAGEVASHSVLGLEVVDLGSTPARRRSARRITVVTPRFWPKNAAASARGCIVSAVSFVGDDAGRRHADLLRDGGNHRGQRMAVIRIAWQGRRTRRARAPYPCRCAPRKCPKSISAEARAASGTVMVTRMQAVDPSARALGRWRRARSVTSALAAWRL
jgi:hypothetical protein